MKRSFLVISLLIFTAFKTESIISMSNSIGQQYINFIEHLDNPNFNKNLESLFSPEIKLTVNSELICKNHEEYSKQMKAITIDKLFGRYKIKVIDIIDEKIFNIIRFDIDYDDNTSESVITILKLSNNQIEKIDVVYGQKSLYSWHSK